MPTASSMVNAKSREGLIQRAAQSNVFLPHTKKLKKREKAIFSCALKKKRATNVDARTGSVVTLSKSCREVNCGMCELQADSFTAGNVGRGCVEAIAGQ